MEPPTTAAAQHPQPVRLLQNLQKCVVPEVFDHICECWVMFCWLSCESCIFTRSRKHPGMPGWAGGLLAGKHHHSFDGNGSSNPPALICLCSQSLFLVIVGPRFTLFKLWLPNEEKEVFPERLGAGSDLSLPLPFPGSSVGRAEGCSAFHLPVPGD